MGVPLSDLVDSETLAKLREAVGDDGSPETKAGEFSHTAPPRKKQRDKVEDRARSDDDERAYNRDPIGQFAPGSAGKDNGEPGDDGDRPVTTGPGGNGGRRRTADGGIDRDGDGDSDPALGKDGFPKVGSLGDVDRQVAGWEDNLPPAKRREARERLLARAKELGASDKVLDRIRKLPAPPVDKKDDMDPLEFKDEPTDGLMERKADPGLGGAQVLKSDPKTGRVTALVSVTGVEDRVKDVIEPGAYTKTMAEREPIGVWSHDDKTWVARTETAKELFPGDPFFKDIKTMDGKDWPAEAGAVLVEAQFNLATPHGAAAFSDVEFFKGKTGWSIGYRATKAARNVRTGVRHIKELDWYEFSPVMVGAASQPMTLSVKSMADDHRVDPDEAKGLFEEVYDELTVAELERLFEMKAEFGLEVKARVRTPAGAKQYGQPIGSVIIPDAPGGSVAAGTLQVGVSISARLGGGDDYTDVKGEITKAVPDGERHTKITVGGKEYRLNNTWPIEVTGGADKAAAGPVTDGQLLAMLKAADDDNEKAMLRQAAALPMDKRRAFLTGSGTGAALDKRGGREGSTYAADADRPILTDKERSRAYPAAAAPKSRRGTPDPNERDRPNTGGQRGGMTPGKGTELPAGLQAPDKPAAGTDKSAAAKRFEGQKMTAANAKRVLEQNGLAGTHEAVPEGDGSSGMVRIQPKGSKAPDKGTTSKPDPMVPIDAEKPESRTGGPGNQEDGPRRDAYLAQQHAEASDEDLVQEIEARSDEPISDRDKMIIAGVKDEQARRKRVATDSAALVKEQALLKREYLDRGPRMKQVQEQLDKIGGKATSSAGADPQVGAYRKEVERGLTNGNASDAEKSRTLAAYDAALKDGKAPAAAAKAAMDEWSKPGSGAPTGNTDAPSKPAGKAPTNAKGESGADFAKLVLSDLEDNDAPEKASELQSALDAYEKAPTERNRAGLVSILRSVNEDGVDGENVDDALDLLKFTPTVEDRADRARQRARQDDADADKRVKDRAQLAALNRRRRAQGKNPLLRMPSSIKALDLAECTDDELELKMWESGDVEFGDPDDLEGKGSSASLDKSPRSNWVEKAGGLPPYFREVARSIAKESGVPLDRAIPMAIGRIKKWARGGGDVKPDTIAKAAAAVAQWTKMKTQKGFDYDSELLDDIEAKTLAAIDAAEAAGIELKSIDDPDDDEGGWELDPAAVVEAKADPLEVEQMLAAAGDLKVASFEVKADSEPPTVEDFATLLARREALKA